MVPCLTDMVLHGVKVMDDVMMEMIGAKMSVIPKMDINPVQRFVDPPWPFTHNYLKHFHPALLLFWSTMQTIIAQHIHRSCGGTDQIVHT